MAERAVVRARVLAADERHLLLAGDPVAPGEVLAAPSAPEVDIAVCLLDVNEAAQRERLGARGDPVELLGHHVAFADWLREHARDPAYRQEVIAGNGLDGMQWSRWTDRAPDDWQMTVIDTLDGRAPTFRRGWC